VGWAQTRAAARLEVHRQFGFPATYTAPTAGSAPVSCTVRLHSKIARFGDLDREGYAEVVEDVTKIIFLQSEVAPVRKALVEVSGKQYTIDLVVPPDDDLIVTCEVKPK